MTSAVVLLFVAIFGLVRSIETLNSTEDQILVLIARLIVYLDAVTLFYLFIMMEALFGSATKSGIGGAQIRNPYLIGDETKRITCFCIFVISKTRIVLLSSLLSTVLAVRTQLIALGSTLSTSSFVLDIMLIVYTVGMNCISLHGLISDAHLRKRIPQVIVGTFALVLIASIQTFYQIITGMMSVYCEFCGFQEFVYDLLCALCKFESIYYSVEHLKEFTPASSADRTCCVC